MHSGSCFCFLVFFVSREANSTGSIYFNLKSDLQELSFRRTVHLGYEILVKFCEMREDGLIHLLTSKSIGVEVK